MDGRMGGEEPGQMQFLSQKGKSLEAASQRDSLSLAARKSGREKKRKKGHRRSVSESFVSRDDICQERARDEERTPTVTEEMSDDEESGEERKELRKESESESEKGSGGGGEEKKRKHRHHRKKGRSKRAKDSPTVSGAKRGGGGNNSESRESRESKDGRERDKRSESPKSSRSSQREREKGRERERKRSDGGGGGGGRGAKAATKAEILRESLLEAKRDTVEFSPPSQRPPIRSASLSDSPPGHRFATQETLLALPPPSDRRASPMPPRLLQIGSRGRCATVELQAPPPLLEDPEPSRLRAACAALPAPSGAAWKTGSVTSAESSPPKREEKVTTEEKAKADEKEKETAAGGSKKKKSKRNGGVRLQPSSKGTTKYRKSRMLRIINATSPHTAVDETELTVAEGDIIVLRGLPEHGWCEGQIDDKTGWFPIAVSEELLEEEREKAAKLNSRGGERGERKGGKDTMRRRKQRSKAVDRGSIIEGKDNSLFALERRFQARPSPDDLASKNILHNSTSAGDSSAVQFDHIDRLTKNMERKKRADVISALYSQRRSAASSSSVVSRLMRSENYLELPTHLVPSRTSSAASLDGGASADEREDSEESEEETLSLEERFEEKFTSSPVKAIEMMVAEKGLQDDAAEIASFLFSSKALNKEAIGEFLGDRSERSAAVLAKYLDLVSFKDLEFDRALRRFLYTFKLPGEAQKIDRLMEAFAQKFFVHYSGALFCNPDSVYILAFSTIMLNTDLHNPSIKKKMTQEEFLSNNRGINGGADLPRVFLEDLYQRIVEDEIKTKDDADFPMAMKRGFLFLEKRSGALGQRKKLRKCWCVLDASGFFLFKTETDSKAFAQYELARLRLLPPVIEKLKRKLYPVPLTAQEEEKEVDVRLLASSQRLWVDWLATFEEVLAKA